MHGSTAGGIGIALTTAVVMVVLVLAGTPIPPVSHSSEAGTVDAPTFAPRHSGCDYIVSLNGTTPVARSSSGPVILAPGQDIAAFLNSLFGPDRTVCLTSGDYSASTEIVINHLNGVTLSLDPGAMINASAGNRFQLQPYIRSSVLLVNASPGTVVRGGDWIGPSRGRAAALRVQSGSNGTTIEDATVSGAGWDGILVYDTTGPNYNVSVVDNFLHNNGRFGMQEFSNFTTGMMGTIVSGNIAIDNRVGGIYTNGVGGVTILHNHVSNSVGNGPGEIGIGVTNGYNDTVVLNHVDHMAWFGIQAFYNNYTTISNNVSTSNAGGQDQSGVTNDHSSFDTVTGNIVESNGQYGVYVERSWNVTVSGNIADWNSKYGIALNHGTIPAMGMSAIVRNACSFNGLGGIILNSAIDNTISMNWCNNNSGDGVLLYNDPGQVGSSGNLISGNWLGNEPDNQPLQGYGVRESGTSSGNTLTANSMLNNTQSAAALVG